MQLQASILALISTITVVSADCFGSGDSWSSEIQLARDGVDYWCDNAVTNGGGLSGSFTAGQTKTRCTEMTANKHAILTVQWTGQGTHSLNDNDCKDKLKQEINACEHGGRRTTADWYFV